MMKRNRILHILCTFVGLLTTASFAVAKPPNVLIILVDDMGYGDPGCFNSESKIRTPHIDGLAREGMRFTDAHAPGPLCHLSRYGLMTGRYPFRANVQRWRRQAVIDPDQKTIASMLREQGYQTAMVGKWHLGFDENGYDQPLPGGPVDRGFGSYFGIRASTDIPPYFYIRGNRAVHPPTKQIAAKSTDGWSPIQGEFWRQGLIAPEMQLHDVLPRFTDEAVQVIRNHATSTKSNQPLLLYLAYPAPHTPWLPSKQFAGQSQVSMYGDFVEMVDAMIGRVLDALDEQKMKNDTLVFFTSDNGPVWYEKDVKRFGHDSSGGLRGMKADAWEAGHRMPFIARWPAKVAAGQTCSQTICFTDLMATLADVIGHKMQAQDGPDSFSFYQQLVNPVSLQESVRPALVMRSGSGHMTVRKGAWKLITALGSGGFSTPKKKVAKPGEPTGQLYNLHEDLGEENNLFQSQPERVSRLTSIMKSVVESGKHRSP